MIEKDAETRNMLLSVRFIDLFSGIGAFRLAFESFGAKCVFSCEWDKNSQDVYRQNYGETPAGDIIKINETEIPEHDILCAGFPCQPFSISGRQRGFDDTRGTLFFDIARIAKYQQPKIIFLENVKNLVSHNGGKTFQTITNVLHDLGYDVYTDVLNVADYGVPQSRKRVYIICFRKDLHVSKFLFPEKIELKRHVIDILEDEKIVSKDLFVNNQSIAFNGTPDHISNTTLRLGNVNHGHQGERIYSSLGTAITLSAYGGGVGAKTGLYLINNKVRRLTPRECARLDGFPDDFKINENKNIAYRQFGNSIVVDVLQYIILQILECGGLK